MRKGRAGVPLDASAATYNTLLDFARSADAGRLSGGDDRPPGPPLVRVRNDTGAALPRIAAVGIDGAAVDLAAAGDDGYAADIILRGVTIAPRHFGAWAILQEPADPDVVVPAVAAGPSVAILARSMSTRSRYASPVTTAAENGDKPHGVYGDERWGAPILYHGVHGARTFSSTPSADYSAIVNVGGGRPPSDFVASHCGENAWTYLGGLAWRVHLFDQVDANFGGYFYRESATTLRVAAAGAAYVGARDYYFDCSVDAVVEWVGGAVGYNLAPLTLDLVGLSHIVGQGGFGGYTGGLSRGHLHSSLTGTPRRDRATLSWRGIGRLIAGATLQAVISTGNGAAPADLRLIDANFLARGLKAYDGEPPVADAWRPRPGP